MRPKQLIKALKSNFSMPKRRPMMIWGQPGIGKSTIIKQVADEIGLQFLDWRLILKDPTDLRGIPHVVKKNGSTITEWARPADFPEEGEGVLLLDELPTCPPLIQVAAYQLLTDFRIGEHKLGDGWRVLGAGNRQTDKAGAGRMLTPMNSRMQHVDLEEDVDDWVEWAYLNGIHTGLIAGVRFIRRLINTFDPKNPNQRSFSCPRTLEYTSDVLHSNPPPEIEFEMVKGTIGEGEAAELMAFLKMYKSIPNLDHILLSPDTAMVPERPDAMFATVVGLARRATEDNFGRILTYAERLPEEFNVLLVKDCVRAKRELAITPQFGQWGSLHKAAMA